MKKYYQENKLPLTYKFTYGNIKIFRIIDRIFGVLLIISLSILGLFFIIKFFKNNNNQQNNTKKNPS